MDAVDAVVELPHSTHIMVLHAWGCAALFGAVGFVDDPTFSSGSSTKPTQSGADAIPESFARHFAIPVGGDREPLRFQPKGNKIKAWHCEVTHARFMGESYPVEGGPGSRFLWWVRMAFVHLPARCLVVTGDLPAHDWHHRYPCRPEWPHAIYARQKAIDSGDNFPNETWGLFAAIDRVFTAMSAQPPQPTRQDGKVRPSELMLGM